VPTTAHEFHLASRPTGLPTKANFRLVERELPDPGDGELLVRNDLLSVDPYMRGRMNARASYIPPFELDQAMDGSAVGTVLASGDPSVPVGATVLHMAGWRDYAVLGPQQATVLDTDRAPAASCLNAMGFIGMTAWAGLLIVAEFKPGDTVFVSGAAGAVGSLAGQIAKAKGAARVIGSAGGPAKAQTLLTEFGYDAAIDYRAGDLPGQLSKAAPDGIDVYFDNVGGAHLEAALDALNHYGRVAVCGAISGYNSTEEVAGPRNLEDLLWKELTVRGYLVGTFASRQQEFEDEMAGWLADGQVKAVETVVEGLENAPDAFLALFSGGNIGKMLVRL
jgi:NADPH-dependent curcumin reductase CurA